MINLELDKTIFGTSRAGEAGSLVPKNDLRNKWHMIYSLTYTATLYSGQVNSKFNVTCSSKVQKNFKKADFVSSAAKIHIFIQINVAIYRLRYLMLFSIINDKE